MWIRHKWSSSRAFAIGIRPVRSQQIGDSLKSGQVPFHAYDLAQPCELAPRHAHRQPCRDQYSESEPRANTAVRSRTEKKANEDTDRADQRENSNKRKSQHACGVLRDRPTERHDAVKW